MRSTLSSGLLVLVGGFGCIDTSMDPIEGSEGRLGYSALHPEWTGTPVYGDPTCIFRQVTDPEHQLVPGCLADASVTFPRVETMAEGTNCTIRVKELAAHCQTPNTIIYALNAQQEAPVASALWTGCSIDTYQCTDSSGGGAPFMAVGGASGSIHDCEQRALDRARTCLEGAPASAVVRAQFWTAGQKQRASQAYASRWKRDRYESELPDLAPCDGLVCSDEGAAAGLECYVDNPDFGGETLLSCVQLEQEIEALEDQLDELATGSEDDAVAFDETLALLGEKTSAFGDADCAWLLLGGSGAKAISPYVVRSCRPSEVVVMWDVNGDTQSVSDLQGS